MIQTKICVVGVGRWGKNHIKTLQSLGVSTGCVETDIEKIDAIKKLFPDLMCFSSIKDSFNENFSGYIIATPPSTHASIASKIIPKKIPILVEKPLALSHTDAIEIKSKLDKYKGKLIVGHLLLFHPGIKKIKTMIDDGKIGKIQYIYSNRLNLGTIRTNENVFWSFAPHDISLFQFFSKSFPSEVTSLGRDFLQKDIHDTTITYLKYPNGIQGHIYVSWLHPFKEHRLVIIGSKGSLHLEDSNISKPLLFYEKDDHDNNDLLNPRNKTPKKIKYKYEMPLKSELKYFISIVKGKKIKKANINEGIDVIRILELASKSLRS